MLAEDDEAESTYYNDVNKNDFKQIKKKAKKVGYADGVNDGRENVFQNGFDWGYKDGLRTSFELEKFRFFFKHLNTDKINNLNLSKENEEYHKLGIKRSQSRQHFKYLDQKDESLDIVSKNQNEHVDKIMKKFANTLPKSNDLLNVQTSTDFM